MTLIVVVMVTIPGVALAVMLVFSFGLAGILGMISPPFSPFLLGDL